MDKLRAENLGNSFKISEELVKTMAETNVKNAFKNPIEAQG